MLNLFFKKKTGYYTRKCHFLPKTKKCIFIIKLDFRIMGPIDSGPW